MTPTTNVCARQSSISSIDKMFPLAKTGTVTFSLHRKQPQKGNKTKTHIEERDIHIITTHTHTPLPRTNKRIIY